jgi:hypothetical protein
MITGRKKREMYVIEAGEQQQRGERARAEVGIGMVIKGKGTARWQEDDR